MDIFVVMSHLSFCVASCKNEGTPRWTIWGKWDQPYERDALIPQLLTSLCLAKGWPTGSWREETLRHSGSKRKGWGEKVKSFDGWLLRSQKGRVLLKGFSFLPDFYLQVARTLALPSPGSLWKNPRVELDQCYPMVLHGVLCVQEGLVQFSQERTNRSLSQT